MKKRRVFSNLRHLYVNLLFTGGTYTELNLQANGETGKFETYYILMFVNMWNYISRQDSLSSVMVLGREDFSLFIPLKLRSAAQIDTGYVSKGY